MYPNLRDFNQLKIITKIEYLTKEIYELAKDLPEIERYNLRTQITRCVSSIGANLAEGNGQLYPRKDINFANNSLGSASETLYWLKHAYVLEYLDYEKYTELNSICIEIQKMLYSYVNRIKVYLES